MKAGKIILLWEEKQFHAGFCFMKEQLSTLEYQLPFLHPDEKKYYETLKFDRRKKSYLLGRIAAKRAICELTGESALQSISIEFGVFQYPVVKYLSDQNIQVSISHCDDIGVALAFPEEHPLGIDIEKADERKIDAMKSQICEKEFELLSPYDLPVSPGYTMIWTIKEALSKVFRTGLTMDLKLLEIESLEKTGPAYTSAFRHCIQYKAISFIAGDHICSVVLPKNTATDPADLLGSLTAVLRL